MMLRHTLPACLLILLSCFHAVQAVDFAEDIRPILSDKCYRCHGPDETSRKAGLRLDQRDSAEYVLDGESAEDTELIGRILSDDPDLRMPPPASKTKLTSQEIDLLKQWVADGANYELHWAFRKIASPSLPASHNLNWQSLTEANPIDRFIGQRLVEHDLRPSPMASKEKLIRRLSFDLTGLPPSPDEIKSFLDDESHDAYVRLVDHFLQKEAYGERMAVDWLDVARYSDSYGYQVDRDRFVWPWRDWVIRAFNQNMPYDKFVTLQLAGDLLPDASDDDILATTFCRLHPQKVEGGSVPEEFRTEYVADRNHTFATAFLGLTMECARCHDHKYDPFTQKEYYQLFAYFNNIDEAGLYSYFTESIPTPTLRLLDDNQKETQSRLANDVAEQEDLVGKLASSDSLRNEFHQWSEQNANIPFAAKPVAKLAFEEENQGANQRVAGKVGHAVQLTGDDGIDVKAGNFRRFQPFSVAFWMQTPKELERAVVFHRSRAWTDAASRGYELLIENGKLTASLVHFMPGNALTVQAVNPVPLNAWTHVAVVYDGSSSAKGLQLWVNGKKAETSIVRDNLYKNITGGGGDTIHIGERFRDRGFSQGQIDEFSVYDKQLSALEIAALHQGLEEGADLRPVASTLADHVGQSQFAEKLLLDHFCLSESTEVAEQTAKLHEVRKALCEFQDGLTEIMVMAELNQRRPTYFLKRGAYDAPSEEVQPQTPAFLPEFPADAPHNRLGLAQWLTSPDNPLFARVTVNRLWQQCFGHGLVRTPEDFGSQGQPPSHPLLLDWLAADLMENGWDVKRTLRLIVSSATYQQSANVSAASYQKDPENRWLARGPSYRLSAEMIRDNALCVSGLLVDKIGGPPVRPYEVKESFKPVDPDKGEGLYRRSLYTYWKRTAPAPAMMTLDASKRDVCSVKRERTASPLQALVLLNDPLQLEASRTLAASLLQDKDVDSNDWLQELFVRTTSRQADDTELQILRRMFDEQRQHFQDRSEQASTFLQVGDTKTESNLKSTTLAAATVVVSAMLNFDECVIKR